MYTSKKLLIIPIIGALFFTSCKGGKTEAANTENSKIESVSKPLVKVEKVYEKDVEQTREFTATVQANVTNKISPQTPVRIEEILVEVGDKVRKGQKLVQMDANNLKQARTQLDNTRVEFNRVDELYKVGGVSKSQWDSQKMALDIAETSYKNLVENTQLISPIDGIITARNYDNGDMYTSGSPVLVVEQISPVKLLVNVSETYFTNVKKGMPVSIQLDVYGDRKFNGEVSLIYPTIDPQTRTFPVEIKIKNNSQEVRPGMFARATMNFGSLQNIVVPDMAIIKQPGTGERYIYVLNKNNTVTYKKVELGRRIGDTYEIISGLEDGDEVVIAGYSRLNNGMEVEVENKK